MTAKEHNKLVGIFLMAHGALQLLVMVLIALVYGGLGTLFIANARRDEEAMIGVFFIAAIAFAAFFALVLGVPQLVGGWKMIKERPGARTWGIVASIVSCLNFPLGTAAGVYGLWFLFGDEGRRFYLGGGGNLHDQQMFNPPPPPPNNWR
ncbi:MAG: hypothetical protein M3384_16630 [Acidobacteriota bacterium]|nr:hypothetical protein [Acidobacteriota bacterium]